jgi:hypothetical protein
MAGARTATSPGVGRTQRQQPFDNNSDFRARGYITADARNQTEYGTVRGYIAVGVSENEHGGDVAAQQRSARTAPLSSGRASRSAVRSRSSTSIATPATSYWGAFPVLTPVTAAGS